VPPLRDRTGDIPLLVDHFLGEFSRGELRRTKTVDPRAIDLLEGYHWPGNVRELKNLVERLTIMTRGSVIRPEDIPDYIKGRVEKGRDDSLFAYDDLKEARDQFERVFIERKLRENDFNITATAKILNMERSHLHKKIRAYKINQGK
jgi:two-component system nitrogen regulation response regulator NtrX